MIDITNLKSWIWGPGILDNLISFAAVDEFMKSSTPLPKIRRFLQAYQSTASYFLSVSGVGALLLGLRGHKHWASLIPRVIDWRDSGRAFTQNDLSTLTLNTLLKLMDDESFKKWSGLIPRKHVMQWKQNLSNLCTELRKARENTTAPTKVVNFAELSRLVTESSTSGTCFRMHTSKDMPGYNEYYVGLSSTSGQTASEMVRCRTVVDLHISLVRKRDVELMVVPFKILLRGWAKSLVRLEVSVPTLGLDADFFRDCHDELPCLPKLRYFTSEVRLSDEDVNALCKNRNLSELRLDQACLLSARCLEPIGNLRRLKFISIYNSNFNEEVARRFSRKNPRVNLCIL